MEVEYQEKEEEQEATMEEEEVEYLEVEEEEEEQISGVEYTRATPSSTQATYTLESPRVY